MKKLLSIIMAVVMVVSCFSFSSFSIFANTDETAPVIELGGTVNISINTESTKEEKTEFYVKFIPAETGWYEFTLANGPKKGAMIMGMILDEDLAPVGEGAIIAGSIMGETYNNLSCANDLTKNKTYYIYVTGLSAGKYTTDITVKKGHTHKYEMVTDPATCDSEDPEWSFDGAKYKLCYACGSQISVEKYYYPKTVTLSKSTYAYDGKAKQPKVTVKDRKGNTISSSNYTVKYSSNKNVGTATVKVVFNNKKYSGDIKKTFTINPAKTSLKSVKAGKKSFTATWAKKASQTTGYQVQYSTDKNFKKGNKTVTVSGYNKSSKTVSGLKAKKKYYVRVRTYKTVKVNGKQKKFYSDWSGAKSVTTKK